VTAHVQGPWPPLDGAELVTGTFAPCAAQPSSTPSDEYSTTKGALVDEFDRIKGDAEALLRDVRGAIDELIVQLDLGGKEARDAAQPLVDKIESGWLEVKARLLG